MLAGLNVELELTGFAIAIYTITKQVKSPIKVEFSQLISINDISTSERVSRPHLAYARLLLLHNGAHTRDANKVLTLVGGRNHS